MLNVGTMELRQLIEPSFAQAMREMQGAANVINYDEVAKFNARIKTLRLAELREKVDPFSLYPEVDNTEKPSKGRDGNEHVVWCPRIKRTDQQRAEDANFMRFMSSSLPKYEELKEQLDFNYDSDQLPENEAEMFLLKKVGCEEGSKFEKIKRATVILRDVSAETASDTYGYVRNYLPYGRQPQEIVNRRPNYYRHFIPRILPQALISAEQTNRELSALHDSIKNQCVVISNTEKEMQKLDDKNERRGARYYICHSVDFWQDVYQSDKHRSYFVANGDLHHNSFISDRLVDFDCEQYVNMFTQVAGASRLDEGGNAYIDLETVKYIADNVDSNPRYYHVPKIFSREGVRAWYKFW